PVMVRDFGTTAADSWSGFALERLDIFQFLTQNSIKNVIFLSADQDWAGAFLINHAVFQIGHGVKGFYEISPSPLAATKRGAPLQNDPQVLFEADQANYYGVARVDTTIVPRQVQFEIHRASDDAMVYSSIVQEFTPTPPPVIVTSSLGQGTVNSVYAQALTATNGVPPYQWSVTNGALPSGLNLNSNGTISGTPTQAATFSFTVTVQDAALSTVSRTLSLMINSGTAQLTSIATITLSYDGQLRDRVGQNELALSADGQLDGVFTVTLNAGSGNRTVTRLQLNRAGPIGVWNTQAGDGFWSLGADTGLDTALLNAANDSVNFALAEGNSFKIFAADYL